MTYLEKAITKEYCKYCKKEQLFYNGICGVCGNIRSGKDVGLG